MQDNVPLAEVDMEVGLKSKYSDLVNDAGVSVLRTLLMNHAMEAKHLKLERKYKDTAEDVEKWRHKAAGL